MLRWSATFLIGALLAAVLAISGLAAEDTGTAWILSVVLALVATVTFVIGRPRFGSRR